MNQGTCPENKNNAHQKTEQPTTEEKEEQQVADQKTERSSGKRATKSYLPGWVSKLPSLRPIIRKNTLGTKDQPTVENAGQQVEAHQTEGPRGRLATAKLHLSGLVPILSSRLSGLVPKFPSLRPISQSSFLELDENDYEKEIIYQQIQTRNSKSPAIINFIKPGYTICAIACVPRDPKTSSPEVKIMSGGLGCDLVELLLTPVYSGPWASCVEIVGYKNPQAITQADNSEIGNTAQIPISREREAAVNLY